METAVTTMIILTDTIWGMESTIIKLDLEYIMEIAAIIGDPIRVP